jgi:hypothetical protein
VARERKEGKAPKAWACNICSGDFVIPEREGEDETYRHIRKNLVRFIHLLQVACDERAELSKHAGSVYSSKDGSLAAKYDEIKKALRDAKEEREWNEGWSWFPLYRIWAEKNKCWRLWTWVNERTEKVKNESKKEDDKSSQLF